MNKVLFTVFNLLFCACALALPGAEDIDDLAIQGRLSVETFTRDSFELRMGYEYAGDFPDHGDRKKLEELTKTAGDELEAIAEKQKKLKKEIEDYVGSDWDQKYGATGLWRKLDSDIYTTGLNKCRIDYYLAVAADGEQRKKISDEILNRIDKLEQTYSSLGCQLLKAKLVIFAQNTADGKIRADELFALVINPPMPAVDGNSDRFALAEYDNPIKLRAHIEKIRLKDKPQLKTLDSLIDSIAQARWRNDAEVTLSLAFTMHKFGYAEGFAKAANIEPEKRDVIGSIILSQLLRGAKPANVSEAEYATQAALRGDVKQYKAVLEKLADTGEFQSPLILYAAGVAIADSAREKAVKLLMDASNLQKGQRCEVLNVDAEKIAEQAAQLAYNLFVGDSNNCSIAIKAFDNYSVIACEKIDERLEYLYAVVLNDCGRAAEGEKVLQRAASRQAGLWRNRARLDLIIQRIEQNPLKGIELRSKLLAQLEILLSDCTEKKDKQLKTEVGIIYAHLLLESEDEESALKASELLSDCEIVRDPNQYLLRSKVFRRLGKFSEAADCLLLAIDPNNCHNIDEVLELLTEVTDKIEQIQADIPDSAKMIGDCRKLARLCHDCSPNWKEAIILVELTLFATDKKEGDFVEVGELLDGLTKESVSEDIDLFRCRARILTAQGQFDKAAQLWSKICQMQKDSQSSTNQRCWKWWRAKFYELNCWAKMPETQKDEVLHTIEVLESSFTNPPALWVEKLNLLKQELTN